MCLTETAGRKAWKVYEVVNGELRSVCYYPSDSRPTDTLLIADRTMKGSKPENPDAGFHLYANRSDARKAQWYCNNDPYRRGEGRKFVLRQVEYFDAVSFGVGDGGYVRAYHGLKNQNDGTHSLQDPPVPVIVSTKIKISSKNFR